MQGPMKAIFVDGLLNGCSCPLEPKRPSIHSKILDGRSLPSRACVEIDGRRHVYELANSDGTLGADGMIGSVVMYFVPHGMSDVDRFEAISRFLASTPPWDLRNLPSEATSVQWER